MGRRFAGVCLVVVLTLPLLGQRIVHQRTVLLHQQSGFWRGVQRVLFGAEDAADFYPFDVEALPDGRFLVTDIHQGSVLLLREDGALIRRVNRVGDIPLGTPVSIVVDDDGKVYIADSTRDGVLRLTSDLRSAELFAVFPHSRIAGIALSGDRLFAVDAEKHCVRCLDKQSGSELFRFGKRGTEPGKLNFPTDIAVLRDRLFVLDTLNFRVQVFDLNGHFQSMFGGPGDGGGHFARPKSLALHPDGLVFVSDVAFDNIQVFDTDGRFLTVVGGHGQKDGTFWMPSGVCLDSRNRVVVSDTYNHRLQIFDIEGRMD